MIMSTSIQEQNVAKALEVLTREIKSNLSKPLYLRITAKPGRGLTIEQVTLITVEEFADLAHVEERTVRDWMSKSGDNGLKFYRAPGTRNYLFDLHESLEWLKSDDIG